MLCQLLNGNPVTFVHLHALNQEKAGLHTDGLWKGNFVAAIVNLSDQVFHFVTVEGSHSDE